jgi:hypothetical protein
VSDGQYYDWAGGWLAAPVTQPMAEIYPGYYETTFPQAIAQPNAWETYRAFYQSTASDKFFRGEEHVFRSAIGEPLTVTTAGTVGDALRVILGLMYGNAVLDNTGFNGKGLLTSGRVRLFATPAAAAAATDGAADDAQGEWARFVLTGEGEASPNEDYTKTFRLTRTK